MGLICNEVLKATDQISEIKQYFYIMFFIAADLLELTESLREWVAYFLISSAWVENGKQRQTLKFGNS